VLRRAVYRLPMRRGDVSSEGLITCADTCVMADGCVHHTKPFSRTVPPRAAHERQLVRIPFSQRSGARGRCLVSIRRDTLQSPKQSAASVASVTEPRTFQCTEPQRQATRWHTPSNRMLRRPVTRRAIRRSRARVGSLRARQVGSASVHGRRRTHCRTHFGTPRSAALRQQRRDLEVQNGILQRHRCNAWRTPLTQRDRRE